MPVIRRTYFIAVLAAPMLFARPLPAAELLTLSRAETLATSQAPWLAHHRTNVSAAAERVTYEGRLPDPQLTLGAVNVPADSFNLRDEDMTMLAVGVRQAFPPGDTLALRARRAQQELSREEARLAIEHRMLVKQIRELWLALYLEEQSLPVLERSRRLQERALAAAEGRYRAAQESQQSVLRSRQTLARLDERLLATRAQVTRLRAQLARYIGTEAQAPLPPELPTLAPLPARFDATRHPESLAALAELDVAQTEVDIARQEYKPGMMLDISYGFRRAAPNGSERSDLITAQVTFDLPLFKAKRQNPRVAEKQTLASAARLGTEDKQRELEATYQADRADFDALASRVQLYAEKIVPAAQREAEVTVAGFARDANERREAQMRVLEAELELLKLRVELARSHVELLYLTGEEAS